MKNELFPIITLTNGVRVMNFNSPHSFEFEDGCVLPAVSDDVAEATKLDNEDIETRNENNHLLTDVQKKWVMSEECMKHLIDAINVAMLTATDVIIAPLPVILAFKDSTIEIPAMYVGYFIQKFRTIYLVDRITKKISITKFCI